MLKKEWTNKLLVWVLNLVKNREETNNSKRNYFNFKMFIERKKEMLESNYKSRPTNWLNKSNKYSKIVISGDKEIAKDKIIWKQNLHLFTVNLEIK